MVASVLFLLLGTTVTSVIPECDDRRVKAWHTIEEGRPVDSGGTLADSRCVSVTPLSADWRYPHADGTVSQSVHKKTHAAHRVPANACTAVAVSGLQCCVN